MVPDTVVCGLYQNRSKVEVAVVGLRSAGFGDADISVIAPENVPREDVALEARGDGDPKEHELHSRTIDGAIAGGEDGALIGGTLGWLTGIGLIVVPVVGPFIAAGSMLAAAGVGGTVGSVVGALVGAGVTEHQALRYEGRVIKDGYILLSVLCENAMRAERAIELLTDTGATDVSTEAAIAGGGLTTKNGAYRPPGN